MSFWFIEVIEKKSNNRIQYSNLYANEAHADKVRECYKKEYPEVDGYMVRKKWIWWDQRKEYEKNRKTTAESHERSQGVLGAHSSNELSINVRTNRILGIETENTRLSGRRRRGRRVFLSVSLSSVH